MNQFTVGIDSGAFSVDTGKVKDLNKEMYAEYLKKHGHRYSIRFNFDVLGNGPASYDNWVWLRKQGHDVMPVYHVGTDEDYLKRYLKESDRIAIGAVANLHTSHRVKGLTYIWNTYLTNSKGRPTHKVHGLGLTSARIMFNYPWHTVDSASALLMGSYGGVFLPHKLQGLTEDTSNYWSKVSLTTRKGKNAMAGSGVHFFSLSQEDQDRYRDYLLQFEVKVGEIPEAEKHTFYAPLFDAPLTEPAPKLCRPPLHNEVILTEHWTSRVAWNMFFMRRFSQLVNGPTIYFVANPHVVESLLRFKMKDFALLISFARKEAELQRFWNKLEGKPSEGKKKSTAQRATVRLAGSR